MPFVSNGWASEKKWCQLTAFCFSVCRSFMFPANSMHIINFCRSTYFLSDAIFFICKARSRWTCRWFSHSSMLRIIRPMFAQVTEKSGGEIYRLFSQKQTIQSGYLLSFIRLIHLNVTMRITPMTIVCALVRPFMPEHAMAQCVLPGALVWSRAHQFCSLFA